MVNFFDLTLEDLKDYLKILGKEKFRAQQVFKWVYEKKTTSFDEMTNLAKDFRSELAKIIKFEIPPIVAHLKSIDGTQKFLFDVGGGDTVEAVAIPSDDRLTLCVSSEIGCNMGCKFCFTGKQKMKRKLTVSEILGQFLRVQAALPEEMKISNIVFMGMGEPLDNSEAVFKAITILKSDWGINFSRRKITVSTSGLVPKMHLISDNKVRLAVSLNAVDDEMRSKLMPINKKYPLKELLQACRNFYKATGDKITFEYVLIKDETDSLENAHKLYKLTKTIPCKINLIPFNEHPGSGFLRPNEESVRQFQEELIRLGAHVLLRKTMGRDIYAACGQLRSMYENHPMKE